MSRGLYDTTAPRRTVSVTLNGDLVRHARDLGLNLSAIAEVAIAEELRRHLRGQLAADAAAYDAFITEHGSFGDALRAHLAAEAGTADDAAS